MSPLSNEATRPQAPPVHAGSGNEVSGIFPVQVKCQRACNHELGSEVFVVDQLRGFRTVFEPIANESDPFSDDPETVRRFGYPGEIKVCIRPKFVQRWM